MSPVSFKTPGVYIEEKNAFPNSVVQVPSSTVAFAGHTEKAEYKGHSLLMKPTRIQSMSEFVSMFGGPPAYKFNINNVADHPDFVSGDKAYQLTQDQSTSYLLFNSMRFFFANGGGACYIVSTGSYNEAISRDKFTQALKTLEREPEPSLVLIPEAVMLPQEDCYKLQQDMIAHCSGLQSRMTILDIYQGYKKRDNSKDDVITRFRDAMPETPGLSYAAAYYPWLNTSIVRLEEINFQYVADIGALQNVLNDSLAPFLPEQVAQIKTSIASLSTASASDVSVIHQTLMTTLPLYKNIISIIIQKLNCLPPAAAVAGIYAMMDNNRGVWKAPANVRVQQVNSVTVNLSNDDQDDLNVPLNGKAINALRTFVGEGVLVWGARTLNANSQDWRYVNVRRTAINIEESIKATLRAFVFEPNSPNTWVTVKQMLSVFLTDVWKQGGLCGSKPEDAFSVSIGLGTTMTADDVIGGYMKVDVMIAITRPAEFIYINFMQQMQQS